jgi:hypothetical protein
MPLKILIARNLAGTSAALPPVPVVKSDPSEEDEVYASRAFGLSLVISIGLLGPSASGAAAAGGPAIPGATFGGVGVVGPGDEPGSQFRYVTVGGNQESTVTKIATDGGHLDDALTFDGSWALPAVTLLGTAGGLSADGERLVVVRPVYRTGVETTHLQLIGTRNMRKLGPITLDGRYSFDAISPDGSTLYLVEYPNPRDPFDYRVRAYDVDRGEFRPGAIVDPEQPDEKMTGQPVARQMSPDGRWAYTLYGGGDETFIHALDTEGATAVCVDLPQFKARDLYQLALSVDPGSGAITVLHKGDPAAIVDPQTFSVGEPPTADLAGSIADGVANPGGASWIGWAAVGVGAALIAALAMVLGRRRRTVSGIDEQALERLVRVDADQRQAEQAETEPVR